MRAVVIGVLLAAGCAGEPGVTAKNAAEYARRLVTDDLPYGTDRSAVRAWFEAHDGCRKRTWEATDEFSGCDRHPTLARSTRADLTLVRCDSTGHADAFAALVEVPCRMYGKCDALLDSDALREIDFI